MQLPHKSVSEIFWSHIMATEEQDAAAAAPPEPEGRGEDGVDATAAGLDPPR